MDVATQAAQTEAPTVFAAPVQTGDALVARIRLDLEREFADGAPPGVDLTAVARDAVAEFADAPVKVFVPVLALRVAREALSG